MTPAQSLFTGEASPYGVVIDPVAGMIYWISEPGAVRVGSLSGSGSPSSLFTGQDASYFLAVLRTPVGTGAPEVSGGSTAGSVLSCSVGSWASDLIGAFLYPAPTSFTYKWSFSGADIAGATSSTYTAPAGGSYACRVTASNQAGSASQTSAAVTVTGGGTPPPIALALMNVSQSHRRWRSGNGLPHIAGVKRPPVGTTFRFTLNGSASVRFAFTQKLPGRRVGHRCVAASRTNRDKRRCTRTLTRGTLSFTVGTGAHRVRFDGRLSKHRRLAPDRYTLIITATDGAGQPATKKLTFTIVSA
jgi:hypothetical protein